MSEPINHAAARERLALQMAQVEGDMALASDSAGTVELDQGCVGRSSRMAALQQQAMAQGTGIHAQMLEWSDPGSSQAETTLRSAAQCAQSHRKDDRVRLQCPMSSPNRCRRLDHGGLPE